MAGRKSSGVPRNGSGIFSGFPIERDENIAVNEDIHGKTQHRLSLIRPLLRAVRVRRQRDRDRQTGQSGHKAGGSTDGTAPAITTGNQAAPWRYHDPVMDGTPIPVLNKTPPVREAAFPARETAACAHCLSGIIEAEAGIWRLAWGGSHFNPYHCEGSPDGHAPRCPQCGSALGTSGGWTSCTADPSHCCHSDDGTVEGCGGCFYEPPPAPPGPGERELYAREQYDLDNPARRPS